MSGVKIILDGSEIKYVSDGKVNNNLPLQWRRKKLDSTQLSYKSREPRFLIGERIGVLVDEPDNTILSVSISNRYSEILEEKEEKLLLYPNVSFGDELIDSNNVSFMWFLNGEEFSTQPILEISSEVLSNRKNNIIKVVCNYDDRSAQTTTQIFKSVRSQQDEDDDSIAEFSFAVDNREVVYNLMNDRISDFPVLKAVTRKGSSILTDMVTYEFDIDGENVYRKRIDDAETATYTLTENQLPRFNELKKVDARVYIGEDLYQSRSVSIVPRLDQTDMSKNGYSIVILNQREILQVNSNIRFSLYSDVDNRLISSVGESSDEIGDEIDKIDWDFGDGSTSSGLASTHVFKERMFFVITATITLKNSQTIEIKRVIKIE